MLTYNFLRTFKIYTTCKTFTQINFGFQLYTIFYLSHFFFLVLVIFATAWQSNLIQWNYGIAILRSRIQKTPQLVQFFFLYQTHASVSIEILCQPLSEPVFSQAFCFVQFYQMFFLHFSHAFFPSPVFLQLIHFGPWRRLEAKLMRQIGSFLVCFVVVAFFFPEAI